MKRFALCLPVLLVLLAPAGILYPLWGRPVAAGEDDLVYFFPSREMTGRAIAQGELFAYNRLEATGMPLTADPQAAVMFPPTWLFAALDAKAAYGVCIYLAFAVAGLGAYVYLRRVGLALTAAVFGAVAFQFSGFLVGHRVHLGLIQTAAFLPWGLWGIELLRSPRSPAEPQAKPLAAFAVLAPVGFLALAAGHWPTCIHMGLAWTAYLLLRARPLPRALAIGAAAGVLAATLAAPQIAAAADLLQHATRHRIGYATAGENSFFPVAGVLAFFPFLFGNRTPNFLSQRWWGPWHQCEMLGYVGLATLALAFAAVWRMYRKRKSRISNPKSQIPGSGSQIPDPQFPTSNGKTQISDLRFGMVPLVRAWTWLGAGAFVWMLGYYLATYRLIHALPVLGIVRCPARMLLVLDFALCTLAACTVHALTMSEGERAKRLWRTARWTATRGLPVAMLAVWGLVAAAAGLLEWLHPNKAAGFEFFVGWADEALAAVVPWNPAVWTALVALAVTVAALAWWLRPGRAARARRAPLLVALLLADLFVVARFVDVAPASQQDPGTSPAARWLAGNAAEGAYRVWGLSDSYHARASELLLPKAANAMGFATINSYGPFQSPRHAHLLGFRIFGTNPQWRALLRGNHLLSLYGVRYLLAAEPEFREVIEVVRVPDASPGEDGPGLLGGDWALLAAEAGGSGVRLRSPSPWRLAQSSARQPVALRADTVYRISLDVRAPEGGAANFLQAGVHIKRPDGGWFQPETFRLVIHPEHIGAGWRRFERTFRTPEDVSGTAGFRLMTMSERPIEVRKVRLRASRHDAPISLGGNLRPGERVYHQVAELPPIREGEPPVAVYVNRLCRADMPVQAHPTEADIEALRFPDAALRARFVRGELPAVPDVGLPPTEGATSLLFLATLPAAVAYVLAFALAGLRRRRR